MDQQGTPIGSTSQGMKNTSDADRYENPVREGPGPIASDSLAAESTSRGGGFSENPGSEPLGVRGASSTFANEDTSGATTLPPAPDAKTRQEQSDLDIDSHLKGPAGLKYTEGAGVQGDFPGAHSAGTGYAGGPTDVKQEMLQQTSNTYQTLNGNASSGHSGGNADTAPSYVASILDQPQNSKPKGNNIKEGGFDSDAPNASFTSDIGTKEDPGRLAESKFQREMAESGPDAGILRQKGLNTEGQGYDVLGSDENA